MARQLKASSVLCAVAALVGCCLLIIATSTKSTADDQGHPQAMPGGDGSSVAPPRLPSSVANEAALRTPLHSSEIAIKCTTIDGSLLRDVICFQAARVLTSADRCLLTSDLVELDGVRDAGDGVLHIPVASLRAEDGLRLPIMLSSATHGTEWVRDPVEAEISVVFPLKIALNVDVRDPRGGLVEGATVALSRWNIDTGTYAVLPSLASQPVLPGPFERDRVYVGTTDEHGSANLVLGRAGEYRIGLWHPTYFFANDQYSHSITVPHAGTLRLIALPVYGLVAKFPHGEFIAAQGRYEGVHGLILPARNILFERLTSQHPDADICYVGAASSANLSGTIPPRFLGRVLTASKGWCAIELELAPLALMNRKNIAIGDLVGGEPIPACKVTVHITDSTGQDVLSGVPCALRPTSGVDAALASFSRGGYRAIIGSQGTVPQGRYRIVNRYQLPVLCMIDDWLEATEHDLQTDSVTISLRAPGILRRTRVHVVGSDRGRISAFVISLKSKTSGKTKRLASESNPMEIMLPSDDYDIEVINGAYKPAVLSVKIGTESHVDIITVSMTPL